MSRLKPVVARAAAQLAEVLALPAAEARRRQVQHALAERPRDIARKQKFTHSKIAARSGTSRTRVTAILNGNLEHVFDGSSNSHIGLAWLQGSSRRRLQRSTSGAREFIEPLPRIAQATLRLAKLAALEATAERG